MAEDNNSEVSIATQDSIKAEKPDTTLLELSDYMFSAYSLSDIAPSDTSQRVMMHIVEAPKLTSHQFQVLRWPRETSYVWIDKSDLPETFSKTIGALNLIEFSVLAFEERDELPGAFQDHAGSYNIKVAPWEDQVKSDDEITSFLYTASSFADYDETTGNAAYFTVIKAPKDAIKKRWPVEGGVIEVDKRDIPNLPSVLHKGDIVSFCVLECKRYYGDVNYSYNNDLYWHYKCKVVLRYH